MATEKRVLVKIFIDGQNFYNRVKDFGLTIDQVNYFLFFEHLLNHIRKTNDDFDNIVLLKSEWYVTGKMSGNYPWKKMREIHLSSHFKDPNDPVLLELIELDTNDSRFNKKYKRIFDKEKGKDHKEANSYRRQMKNNIKTLENIRDRYKGLGPKINDTQLDLIYLKYCGFLKMHFETRLASEKGVDVAIASQMLSSILDTSTLQQKDDIDDVIPDYNSDILVLISTDMDFIEPLRILHTMGKPVYMVHIQERMVKNLITQHLCHQIHISKETMEKFI